jgi:hypothetical protein
LDGNLNVSGNSISTILDGLTIHGDQRCSQNSDPCVPQAVAYEMPEDIAWERAECIQPDITCERIELDYETVDDENDASAQTMSPLEQVQPSQQNGMAERTILYGASWNSYEIIRTTSEHQLKMFMERGMSGNQASVEYSPCYHDSDDECFESSEEEEDKSEFNGEGDADEKEKCALAPDEEDKSEITEDEEQEDDSTEELQYLVRVLDAGHCPNGHQ